MNRRRFIKKAGAVTSGAIAFPYFVPSSALGLDGSIAPSNRVTIGLIGAGDRGMHVLKEGFLPSPKAQVTAVCDTAKWRVKGGIETVDEVYDDRRNGERGEQLGRIEVPDIGPKIHLAAAASDDYARWC